MNVLLPKYDNKNKQFLFTQEVSCPSDFPVKHRKASNIHLEYLKMHDLKETVTAFEHLEDLDVFFFSLRLCFEV